MKIKKATVLDNSRIIMLLLDWLDEAALPFPGATDYTGLWMADMIANQVMLIVEDDYEIVGCMGLRVGHFPWNIDHKILMDECFMVRKDKRFKGAGDMLMEAAKDIAKEKSMDLLFGHFTGKDSDLKDRFISKHGFTYAGGTFFYKGV